MNPISIQYERPKFSCLKTMHFYSICILNFFLFNIFVVPCDAQPWKQMGPGAGGQERALYLHTNHAGNYELFVGSDVSGIWRSNSINPNDINNPVQYRFKYISNHRIFRFVNKFYHPDSYDSEFLFALNRSGIDRIDLNDPSAEMKSVNINYGTADFSESWISDIYIGAPDPSGDKVVYFTTGNTRVSDNVIKNHKHSSISDIYLGILNSTEDEITINTQPITLGLNPPYKDVYCLLVDDNGTSQSNDDIILAGSDLALHVGDFTNGLVAVTPPIDITASSYEVTSLLRINQDKILVTIHGYGVYMYDHSLPSNPWTKFMNSLNVNTSLGTFTNIWPNPDPKSISFTKLHALKDVSGVAFGYIVTNEYPKIDGTSNYIGVYYSDVVSGTQLPDGHWVALEVYDALNNEWGWNSTFPCSNINGAVLSADNQLFIGKQGNIFKAKDPISTTSTSSSWQQIYTKELVNNCSQNGFTNNGYVNTLTRCIFPETIDKVWETHHDRLFWYKEDDNNSFLQVKPNGSSPCYGINNSSSTCTVSNSALSDVFFVKEYNNTLFAGVAEGFSSQQGNGFILENNSTVWSGYKDGFCGDPINFFKINNIDYLYMNDNGATLKKLFYSNGSSWIQLDDNIYPDWGDKNIRDVDMFTTSNNINHFVILANSTGSNQTLYYYNNGDLSSGSLTPVCTLTNVNSNIRYERIKILPYGSNGFKILVGGSPTGYNVITDFLFEVDPGNCTLSPLPGNPSIFQKLNFDPIDNADQGITAIEVNETSESIYVAVVGNDNSQSPPVKSFLYKGTYFNSSGQIGPSWTDITGEMPNKTITSLTTRLSPDPTTCNAEYAYASLRGLGAWKLEENPIEFILDNTEVCSGSANGTITVANTLLDPTETYLWSDGQTANSATGLGPGTYTVTISYNGCSTSGYATITENPNCCNTYVNYLDQSHFNGTSISGEFNLNENVTCAGIVYLDGATVSIKEGVSILVPSGSELHVFNSELYACGNMWAGIIVENGGQLFVHVSEIRDAQYGTKVNPDGNLILRNSTYDHNYVGVYVKDLSGGSVIIDGTTFSCNDCLGFNPLKRGYSGQIPAPNVISFAGIEAYNSIFDIGVSGSAPNVFKDCTRGASLENCYNTIVNNTFSDITAGVYYLPLGGYGIFSDMAGGGVLRQLGYGEFSYSPISFENCPTAIYSKGGATSLLSNHMMNVEKGIRIDKVKGQNINASNNLIVAIEKGILLNNNEDAVYIDVNNNNVIINSPLAAGISVFESTPPSVSRKFRINCNSVAVDEGIDGILINSADRINLAQNNITLNSSVNPANGIRIQGSSNCGLLENNVTGNSTTRHIAYGIYVSPANNFTNNHSDLTEIGFDFGSNCATDELFSGNTFGEHDIGLHLNGSGIIGVQTHRGNMWFGPFGILGGAQNENVDPNEVVFNPIIVHDSLPGSLYHPDNNVSVGAQWIFVQSGTPWSGTFVNPCHNNFINGDDNNESRITYTDSLVVMDSISAVQYEDELKYFTDRELIEKLILFDSLRNDNGIFENFYNLKSGSSESNLSNVNSKFKFEFSSQAIEAVNESLYNLMDSLIILDRLVLTDTSNLGLYKTKIVEIQLAIDSLHAQISVFINQRDSIAATANLINSNLIPSGDIEIQEKQVNEFYFQFKDSLISQIDQTTLENISFIASLCPFAYGKSVYRARSELMRYGIENNYDDKSTCTQLGYSRMSQAQSSSLNDTVQEIFIYPNPVRDELKFTLNENTVLFHIIVQDIAGRIVIHLKQSNSTIPEKLDVSILETGIYTITFSGLNGFQHTSKFTIIK